MGRWEAMEMDSGARPNDVQTPMSDHGPEDTRASRARFVLRLLYDATEEIRKGRERPQQINVTLTYPDGHTIIGSLSTFDGDDAAEDDPEEPRHERSRCTPAA